MPEIHSFTDYFVKIWTESADSMPVFKRIYTSSDQNNRENNFNAFQEKIKSLQSKNNVRALKRDAGQSFFPVFKAFLENIFDFETGQLEIILSDAFKSVSKDFFYKARRFGPELPAESIYQGMRNVWIMNGLQLKMGLPVEITPSVFAYSMIYPYSDNLLDDPRISNDEKREFSRRFNRRLHGEKVDPQNNTESQLYRLAGMIEEQFPRQEFSGVYKSLYAIHDAQTRSLNLINCNGLDETEVRKICFEKGGASVLADGYLVAGHLSEEQARALFGYGIYLQMLDDIQDAKEDTESGMKTLFSCHDDMPGLSAFVNRTIHFGRVAMNGLRCFPGEQAETMLHLMNHSVETMIIESVGLNPGLYSDEYLQAIEKHSPLRFAFIREKRTQSKSQRFSLFKKYFEQATAKPTI